MLKESVMLLVVLIAVLSLVTVSGDEALMEVCKGDVNLDGRINGLDIDPFAALIESNLTNSTSEGELMIWLGDFNYDLVVDSEDIDPFVKTLVGKMELVCINRSLFESYDFVHERDVKAYQCRLGPHPTKFPDYFDAEICNRQFLEITHDSRLDQPDKLAVGGDTWTNYATHHFFVLENIDKSDLRGFSVNYVSYNGYYIGEEHHYLYVKNFETNGWELIDEAIVPRLKQGFMEYASDFGSQEDYVNDDGEMWFMGTEGPLSSTAIGSDTFSATLRFSIFG